MGRTSSQAECQVPSAKRCTTRASTVSLLVFFLPLLRNYYSVHCPVGYTWKSLIFRNVPDTRCAEVHELVCILDQIILCWSPPTAESLGSQLGELAACTWRMSWPKRFERRSWVAISRYNPCVSSWTQHSMYLVTFHVCVSLTSHSQKFWSQTFGICFKILPTR